MAGVRMHTHSSADRTNMGAHANTMIANMGTGTHAQNIHARADAVSI